jgi:hypothetical protein
MQFEDIINEQLNNFRLRECLNEVHDKMSPSHIKNK